MAATNGLSYATAYLGYFSDYAIEYTTGDRGSSPRKGKILILLHSVHTRFQFHSIKWVPEALSLEVNGRRLKLTAHLLAVLRLKMCGAVVALPYTLHGVELNQAQKQLYLTIHVDCYFASGCELKLGSSAVQRVA
jgi:hypothetical protein